METLKIYKDIEVTYSEFEQALISLGYVKKQKNDRIFYINQEFDSIISILNQVTPDMKMLKADFTANAFLMEMKGVLNNKDDIAKMIESNRLNPTFEQSKA